MKRFPVGILIFLLTVFCPVYAGAAETDLWMDELDFSEISGFLEDTKEAPLSFEELIEALLNGEGVPYETVGEYIRKLFTGRMEEHKTLVFWLIAVSAAFSVLKSYAKSFSNSYISEICFFLCYCLMMALLLASFSEMNETILSTAERMAGFMKALVPVYCTAISFSLQVNASAAAYSLIFTAVYLVEWALRYVLAPLVQIYVMMEFLNHLTEEERFGKLAEMIADAVRFLLKAAVTFVLGINIIQGMVAPAMDRLAGNTVAKTIQMVPGLGNVANGMGQIFISSGLMIKNSVGAAALIVLVILCAVPFLNMALLAALYKCLSAVLEPIADKRLSGGMNGIAVGGALYLKILSTCLMLFFLTIALTAAATGFGMGG